jgi:hypothetical protein
LFFPETAGRTLEELSFCECFVFSFLLSFYNDIIWDGLTEAVFEGKEKADEVAHAAANQIFEGVDEKRAVDAAHVEVMDEKRVV